MWGWRKKRVGELPGRFESRLVHLNSRLRDLADVLQKKTALWSARRQKTALLLFCLTFLAASVCVIWNALTGNGASFQIEPIRPVPLVSVSPRGSILNEAEHERLHRLKQQLDSLALTPAGKQRLDSILLRHRGLAAKVLDLDKAYHLQKK